LISAMRLSSRFLISAEGLAGHEDQYRDISDPDQVLLVYNSVNERGDAIPPPQFLRFDPNIGNYQAAKATHEANIQQLTRTPPSALGESQGAQESGRKIRELNMQSGLANSDAGRGLESSGASAVPGSHRLHASCVLAAPSDAHDRAR
jgi:hypothetical protein